MTDRPEGLSAEDGIATMDGPNTHKMDAPDVTNWTVIPTTRSVVTADGRGFEPRDEWWHVPTFVVEEIERTLDAARDSRPVVTHGRHCPCSACGRQDWAEPGLAPCGMHGPSCPPIYAPIRRDPRPVGEGLRYAPRPWVKNDDDPLDWLREAAHGFYDAKFGPAERSWIDDRIARLTDQPASTEVGEDG